MSLTDGEFREEYHPLLVPSHFDAADTQQNQLIFALARVGEGSAADVIAELEKHQGRTTDEKQRAYVQVRLKMLFDKGLVNGYEVNGMPVYNLNKVTQANDGATDPDLLAPGLD